MWDYSLVHWLQESSDVRRHKGNFDVLVKVAREAKSYKDGMKTLRDVFERPVNEVCARHRQATRRQLAGESIHEFLQALRMLSMDCNFKAVSATTYQEKQVRDAFVCGLQSQTIRQRLLESKTCDLASLLDLARILESAQKSCEAYGICSPPQVTAAATLVAGRTEQRSPVECEEPLSAAVLHNRRCFFCGLSKRPRLQCSAREALCRKCGRKGPLR
ncbi:hypothetical protein M514_08578 [Trichuris suis]|uniref:Tick transposon n=1 Tax=Trichuris suis TaxID=68888 RepID=A0A085LZW4_9BILA|nr:hypothetical protein M513_08578 [Trichuris suis]KFD63468.1 hypothetical protein M514_08578 [Trichuris suis]